MLNINKRLPAWRMLSLVVVVAFGILSILGTGEDDVFTSDPFDIADAGPDQHVKASRTVYLDGSGSNTPLGANPVDNSAIYRWEIVEQPADAPTSGGGSPYWESATNIINPEFNTSFFDGEYPAEYVIRLTVRHNGHTGIDTVRITAYIENDEVIPVANAGVDIIAKHGALIELNASRSLDFILFTPLSYNWFMDESPFNSTTVFSSTGVVNPSFIAEFNENDIAAGVSHYRVGQNVVNDVDEKSHVSEPDFVDVYVYPAEGYVYPTSIAGPDQRVNTVTQVNLDGSASHDVDGRVLSYDWQFYSRPAGSQAVLSDANTATPFFTPDLDGVYIVFLSVDNGVYNSDRKDGHNIKYYDRQHQDRVKVMATSSGFPQPVPNLGPDQRISYEGQDSLILDASRTTPSYDSTSYYWLLINKPATSNATLEVQTRRDPNGAQLNYDMEGDYVVRMDTGEEDRSLSDTIVYKVTTNTAPVADAGADKNVTANVPITLNGSDSSDAELDSLGYSWSLVSTPVNWTSWPGEWPLLSEGTEASPTFTPTVNGEYRLRLTVNDLELSSVADEVLITVTGSAANSAPTADAGIDQSVTVGDTVLLDGGGSSDPDNDTLIYNWTIEIRPLGSSAAIGDPSFETPKFVPDIEGSYEVQLIVNDGQENSNPDTMTVTATAGGGVLCANPLTLMTTLPFAPNMGEMATNIQIDAEGVDTLSAVTAFATVAEDVYRASIPDGNELHLADFVIYGSNWEEISRSHENPISRNVTPSFVVRSIANDIYYKLDVNFSGTGDLEVQIDTLIGCRCGSSAGDCP